MLRYSFVLIILLSILSSCVFNKQNESERDDSDSYIEDGREKHSQLVYDKDFHDFGTIKHGEVVSYSFGFTNTGNIPLVIQDVIVGCGCTKPKLSKKILKPNELATMEIVFDSKGWLGVQHKSATIVSNGIQPRKSVTIKVNIVN